jgi:hypothetical protein
MAGMPLLGSLELRFDTLSQGEHRVEDVVATVELTDSAISVSDASFDAWGGRASGSLRVDLGGARHQPFALALRLEDAAASSFFRSLKPEADSIRGSIDGRLDMAIDLAGSTDAQLLPVAEDLTGEARLTLTDGHVAGTGVNMALADFLESEHWTRVPFSSLRGSVAFHEGTVEIVGGDLDGELGRVAFRGFVDFGGTADMSMALLVPASQLHNVSLRRTGVGASVVEHLRDADRPLDLGLHLSGALTAPTLEPNAADAVELARR